MEHIFSSKPKPQSFHFVVEVGPSPETIEKFMEKVFAAMGLNTPDKIRAFDNYLRTNFNVPHFYQDNFNKNRNDPEIIHALKNEDKRKRKILFYVPADIVAELKSFGIDLTVGDACKATFLGYKQIFPENVRKHLKTEADFVAAKETPISQWTTVEKLDSVIRRAAILLPEDVGKELLKLLEPWALAAMAVVLGFWLLGHFVGWSGLVDVILLILGGAFLGAAVIQAADHLYLFTVKCINGNTNQDLDESAQHLSEAIALIGVQTVMTLLLVKAPRVFSDSAGMKLSELPSVDRPMGEWFYKPKIYQVKSFEKPGTLGSTTVYGDIEYLSDLTGKLKEETILHEKVHRFLTPKLYPLRNLRVKMLIDGYNRSFLLKYLEEALAETVAQVGTYGTKNALVGIKFPVQEGYVKLIDMRTEAIGIFLRPINAGGMFYRAYFILTENRAYSFLTDKKKSKNTSK